MKIRPATNADTDAVRRIVFAILREHGLQPDPTATDADLDDIEAAYLRTGGTFDVLEDDAGRIVGSVGLFRIDDATCELRKMYLSTDQRGRGHGRRLLEHAIARAREMGFCRMELETSTRLPKATALYERYGFRPFSRSHVVPRCDLCLCLDLTTIKGN